MQTSRVLAVVLGLLLAFASPALAYVGPGAGLTAIGAAFAFAGAVVLAIIGFIWYPIKRLLRVRTGRKPSDTPVETL
ncbi:MAG TPA: hypothetical protein VGD94_25160 [Vicinamibacterales bacterium]